MLIKAVFLLPVHFCGCFQVDLYFHQEPKRTIKLLQFLSTQLRYHGRWVLATYGKKLFFAVQIEKTEINIEKKAFLLFKIEETNYF